MFDLPWCISRRAMPSTGHTPENAVNRSQVSGPPLCRPVRTARDFVAVGDVDIKVIGADNQILDSEVPVRQIMEQLVSATGLPPFMLGFNWSTTERMSSQQADMITSELTAVRRSLTPVIRRICDLWLAVHGFNREYQIVWDDINLQDAEGEAHAELYRAQAEYYRLQAENHGKEV